MMRVLHAVKPHEQFVASGIYQHQEDGKAVGTTEQWSVHELPDGAYLIRVDYDAREERGLTVLVEALTLPGRVHEFERFDTHQISPGGRYFHKSRMTVTINEGGTLIGTAINGGEMEYREMVFAPGTLVYPPGQVFAGALVKQLVAKETPVPVFLLLTGTPGSDEIIGYARSIHAAAPGSTTLGGKEIALKCHTLAGSNPTLSGVFCLNEQDILMRFAQPGEGGHERVIVLTQYAHR
ncbi:MAG: hypothetical protein H6671_01255 [Anaerolineaceae bacterium]|nr:hypothetical protein [Anaerolineaceae bacterium]